MIVMTALMMMSAMMMIKTMNDDSNDVPNLASTTR